MINERNVIYLNKKLILAITLIIGATAFIHVNAAKISWGPTKGFDSKWGLEKKWKTDPSDDGFSLTCKFGYDTFLTNEDYVKDCKSTLLSHEAAVKNSKGTSACTGLYRPGYKSNKADVKHTGSKVTYYMATAAEL